MGNDNLAHHVDIDEGDIGKLQIWDLRCLLSFSSNDARYKEFDERSKNGLRAVTIETLLAFLSMASSPKKSATECLEFVKRHEFWILDFSEFNLNTTTLYMDRLIAKGLKPVPHEVSNAAVARFWGVRVLVIDPENSTYKVMFDNDRDQNFA